MKKQILLVDGMALLFRGYFATAYTGNFMKNSQGVALNGIHQFLRYFLHATNTFQPAYVVCCWDMGSTTYRTELYPEYKANRDAPPEELQPQFELVKEVVSSFDVPNIGLVNYEADDCIGTLAHQYKEDRGYHVTILTGDLDMLQLVDKQIDVAIMRKGIGNYEMFSHEDFYEMKGIHPYQIIDLKGMMGDRADNYPGIKGIGEKTGIKLLQKYDTVDNVLENMHELTPAMQKKFQTDIDNLHISKQLAQINVSAPIKCALEDAIWNYNEEKVNNKLEALEMKHIHYFM